MLTGGSISHDLESYVAYSFLNNQVVDELTPLVSLLRFPCFWCNRGLVVAFRILRFTDLLKSSQDIADDTLRNVFARYAASGIPESDIATQTIDQTPHPALMVVVPGLFQTLDTLEAALSPLLKAHRGLTLLLVAPPGLPNTHWPTKTILGDKVRVSAPPEGVPL